MLPRLKSTKFAGGMALGTLISVSSLQVIDSNSLPIVNLLAYTMGALSRSRSECSCYKTLTMSVSGFILNLYLGSESLIPYVLVANAPQVIISLLYITYNGLFTAMLANREWASYVHKRAPLRVTIPKSTQRSTYSLSLPWKYSLPLIIASILLHWFISQTLFIAPIAVYKDGVLWPTMPDWYQHAGGSVTGLGFSDSALIAATVMGCLLVVACLAVAGLCKYPTGIPLRGTNSAVISAACHVKNRNGGKAEGLDDIVERPLKWGVTIEGTKDQAGHCSFSDRAVQKPVEGCLYA